MDAKNYNPYYITKCPGCRELRDEYEALVKAHRDGGAGASAPPETHKKPDGKKRDVPDADDSAASSEAAAKMARAAM